MARIFSSFVYSSSPPSLAATIKPSKPRISAVFSMENKNGGRKKFMEFPYVSQAHRDLMYGLVSTMENRLGTEIQPCNLPADVQYYHNPNGSAQATLHIRSGVESSTIDFILGSWIHCNLPTGGELNITSLSGYLNPSTDAPNFVFELIRSSPTSLVLILDLPSRKDLVLYPDYLQTFYENTKLDTVRQPLLNLPEVKPYISSSLYIRCINSPTSIMVCIETKNTDKSDRMEEIIKDFVDPIAKQVLGIWLDHCVYGKRIVRVEEMDSLAKRDMVVKMKTIEVDIGLKFPMLFGSEVAERVVGVMREVYGL